MDHDARVAELEAKATVERKCRDGALLMLHQLTDRNAREQCEANVAESEKRLEFLEGELRKVAKGRGGGAVVAPVSGHGAGASTTPGVVEAASNSDSTRDKPSTFISTLFSPFRRDRSNSNVSQKNTSSASLQSLESLPDVHCERPIVTAFDYGKAGSFSATKIKYKFAEIQAKLEIEQKVKDGTLKMYDAIKGRHDKDELRRQQEVANKIAECSSRITLLHKALQRYQGVYVPDDDDADLTIKSTDELPARRNSNSTAHKKYTGRLKINLQAVQGLAGKKSLKTDCYCVIRFDGHVKARSKMVRNGKWNEDIEISVEGAVECEIAVYEKVELGSWRKKSDEAVGKEEGCVLAILWWRFGDLEDDLITYRNAPPTHSLDALSLYNASEVATPVPTMIADGERRASNTSLSNVINMPPAPVNGGIAYVLDMEPAGELYLKLNLLQDQKKKRKRSGLARRRMVQKTYPKQGHKFIVQQFYQIMKCATCGEFLMSGSGYQCQLCKYTCHKGCYNRVINKCITKTDADKDDEGGVPQSHNALLRHNIAHRFEANTNISPNWCVHCAYMLPLGKKQVVKCTECGACAHRECAALVPNFCGLSYELRNQMIQAIELSENERRSKETVRDAIPPRKESGQVELVMTADGGQMQVAMKTKGSIPEFGLDDFHFLAVLGKGNFGKVMLSEDKVTRQLYAIKVLKKEFIIENDEIESTKYEKRVFLTISRDRHPFLVNLHSCFQNETRIFFVMEYISGGDLMWHIQHQQFSERRARFYACEVLMGLEYFHRNNIIYRDLKLDNILLTLDGHVKIADYGLCKENMGYGATTNTFCGTPEFMAPEILLERPYNRAVDWWAFGVLIYEMLLGQSPFRGEDEDEIFDAILHDEILYPVNMSRDAVSLLQRLLTRDPSKRLGGGKSDAEEVKKHPYFRGVDWDAMLNVQVPPPFYPQITNPTDISNFDEEFTRERPVLTPVNSVLTAADQEEFREFTFVSDWAVAMRNQAPK